MKKLIVFGALLLSGCAAPPPKQGVGFGDRLGGGTLTMAPTAERTAPITRATTPLTPLKASGPVPSILSTVKPKFIERMRADGPVPVYASSANLSDAEITTLSSATKKAIDDGPDNHLLWGHKREAFGFGLVNGTVIRVRLNGMDFAQLMSGTVLPSNKNQVYAAIAYRSGCEWNGIGDARVSPNPYIGPTRVGVWYVGINC